LICQTLQVFEPVVLVFTLAVKRIKINVVAIALQQLNGKKEFLENSTISVF